MSRLAVAGAVYHTLASALIAGLLTGLVSYSGGATIKAAVIGGLISALKDAQSLCTPPPLTTGAPAAQKGIPANDARGVGR